LKPNLSKYSSFSSPQVTPSSHRYIIQERLKLSGAWFQSDNARAMLERWLQRANNQWQEYWENLMPQAA
jgi:hypothetical protein